MRLKRREGEKKGVRAAQENTNSCVHARTFNTVYLCPLSNHSKTGFTFERKSPLFNCIRLFEFMKEKKSEKYKKMYIKT